jgi:predicted 3-demethylubiquinone-9 3-methyltransferase (glyoxalase superfamily)
MQRITTFLTFNDRGEEAVEFYTATFNESRIVRTTCAPGTDRVLSLTFELEGQTFMALNGGPSFSFAQGISLFVSCDTQAEVDELWAKLSDAGEEGPCGWLTDKFGVSWQVVPRVLGEMLSDQDPAKAERVMNAMLTMSKLEIDELQRAYEGAAAN